MTINEAIHEWFEKPMNEYIKTNPKELIDYLNTHPQKLTIVDRKIDFEDVKKRATDPNYLNDTFITTTDESITINITTPEVINFFANNISKELEELVLPNYFLEDVKFLANFPNLKKITITGYCKLTEEEIEFIKNNTNITEIITTNGSIVSNDYKPKEQEVLLKYPSDVLISGNLICRANNVSYQNDTIEAVISGHEVDLDLLKKAYDLSIKSDKKITKVIVKSTELMDENNYDRHILEMEIDDFGNIKKLDYNGKKDPTKLSSLVHRIEKERTVQDIHLKCENKTYDKMYYLTQITKNHNLTIDYGDLRNCRYEEFLAMRKTIDWFNYLVRESNLSPAEVVLAAYDIMKTFKYKENEEQKEMSRYLHNIVMTDYIVCVGYAKFLNQILNENNIPSTVIGVTCTLDDGSKGGHERTMIKLDDERYNIHGIFCLDATWDSSKDRTTLVETENGKKQVRIIPKETDKIEKEYDPIGLYRYFLVNPEEYETVYKNDSIPELIELYKSNRLQEVMEENHPYKPNYPFVGRKQMVQLFGSTSTISDIKQYMKTPKPSLEVFRNILFNVRKSQGYTTEEAKMSTDESIELNQMIDEYNIKQETFFQSSQRKL